LLSPAQHTTSLLNGKQLTEIDGKLVVEIIRARTVARDELLPLRGALVALSFVINFAIDQGWLESSPVFARLKRVEERREPSRCHHAKISNWSSIARPHGQGHGACREATGTREAELLRARATTLTTRDDLARQAQQAALDFLRLTALSD
jgi:hypothetical protein